MCCAAAWRLLCPAAVTAVQQLAMPTEWCWVQFWWCAPAPCVTAECLACVCVCGALLIVLCGLHAGLRACTAVFFAASAVSA